jgi:hypothetical protein
MSQAVEEQKTSQKVTVARKRQPPPTFPEHTLEMESRLRREEADAFWKRLKEMILIGSAAFVILSAGVASTYLIVSKGASPSDRQQAFYVLGNMMSILVGVVMGKTIKWGK